ncbi:MAG: hypothetical protein ACTHJ4_04795, partial [Candidatus Nucleicultricaceae bacterium]
MQGIKHSTFSKKHFKKTALIAALLATTSISVAYGDTVEIVGTGPYWDPGKVLYNGAPPPNTMIPLSYFDGDTLIMRPNYVTTDPTYPINLLEFDNNGTLQFNIDGSKANPLGQMQYLMTSVQLDATAKIKLYMPQGAQPAPAGTYELIVIDPAQASTFTVTPGVTYSIDKDPNNTNTLNTITSVSYANNKLTIVLGGGVTPPNPPVTDEGTNTTTTVSTPTYQIQSFTQQLVNVSGS